MHTNIELTLRDTSGMVVDQRRTHNRWTDFGKGTLAHLLAYSSFTPETVYEDKRPRYVGFGIGGKKQTYLSTANNPPLSVNYPVTSNTQDDLSTNIVLIERPIRIQAGTWIREFNVPTFDDSYSVRFSTTFAPGDITYGGLLCVPISEVALFLSDATVSSDINFTIAYDAFESVVKTDQFYLDVSWVLKF